MTQIWKEKKVIPATVISVPENTITLTRTKEKDGYLAIQISMGHTLHEFRTDKFGAPESANVGDAIGLEQFVEGDGEFH